MTQDERWRKKAEMQRMTLGVNKDFWRFLFLGRGRCRWFTYLWRKNSLKRIDRKELVLKKVCIFEPVKKKCLEMVCKNGHR